MSWRKIHIVTVVLLCFSFAALAQHPDADDLIETIIESLIEELDEDADATQIIEDLEALAENPLNINAANDDDFAKLHLLNETEIARLLNYIADYDPVLSIYELQTISGFTQNLLQKIEPFVVFGKATPKKQSLKEKINRSRQFLLIRNQTQLQKANGFYERDDGTTPFEGNRFRHYARYGIDIRQTFSAGFTAEKDPGESFFNNANKTGFDFYSAHATFHINRTLDKITVGDFTMRTGQGLVLWQGYSAGKSTSTLQVSKTGQGQRGYTSVDENLHFRGVAVQFRKKQSQLNIFASHKKADANIDFNQNVKYFTSLQTSGYHRTQNEIADERSVTNSNAGLYFSHNSGKLKFGGTLLLQHFNTPYFPKASLYNRFRFSGKTNTNASFDYTLNRGSYNLFGEAAISKSKGKAMVQGANLHLHDQLQLSALFRHFDKNYHALWGNAFSESSNTNNETGFYLGVHFLPAKKVTIQAYSDVYKTHWLDFTTAGSARGWDIFVQTNFQLNKNCLIYLRFKNEEKDYKRKHEQLYFNQKERIQKIRLHATIQASEYLKLKTRAEHIFVNGTGREHGLLLYQDLQFYPPEKNVSIAMRLAWFHTTDYAARIYAYENDLLYTFSVPAYYGKGFREYLYIHHKPGKNFEWWFKIANTLWTDRNTVGSGYYKIDGNNKTELKIQLRLKF